MKNKIITVCYFGTCDMSFSRNKIYSDALRAQGVRIIECVTNKKGIRKYVDLIIKHSKIRQSYDVLIVGYPGYVTTLLAKIISSRRVFFDALCSRYDSDIISRNAHRGSVFKKILINIVDWSALVSADCVLVETQAQKEFVVRRFGLSEKRVIVMYISADESVFKKKDIIKKEKNFTILFRGRIMSEAGVPTILRAAEILKEEDIYFDIIGFGWGPWVEESKNIYKTLSKEKVVWTEKQLPFRELLNRMGQADISLGQFGNSERLERTIPHKAYESMLLQVPYITASAHGIKEIMEDGKHCLMVPAEDSRALADSILYLKNNPIIREYLVNNAYYLYKSMYSNKVVGVRLLEEIKLFSKKPMRLGGFIKNVFFSIYFIFKQ